MVYKTLALCDEAQVLALEGTEGWLHILLWMLRDCTFEDG